MMDALNWLQFARAEIERIMQKHPSAVPQLQQGCRGSQEDAALLDGGSGLCPAGLGTWTSSQLCLCFWSWNVPCLMTSSTVAAKVMVSFYVF